DGALVGEVDLRQLDAAGADVLPDVGLGPVGDGEDTDVLARQVAAVVQVPQLRALAARVPAAEGVADGEDALLGAGPLLVAAGAAEDGVVALLGDGLHEGDGLQGVAGAVG